MTRAAGDGVQTIQYILKNIVLVSAALTIGATVRGGGLIDDPEVLETAGGGWLNPSHTGPTG
jgi:hypothetical protein